MIITSQGTAKIETAFQSHHGNIVIVALDIFTDEYELQRFSDEWFEMSYYITTVVVSHESDLLDTKKFTYIEFPEFQGYSLKGKMWSKTRLLLTFAKEDACRWEEMEVVCSYD